MVIFYVENIYDNNYARNNTNQIEKHPGLLITFSLILSNAHLYERPGNWLGDNLQIKLPFRCED